MKTLIIMRHGKPVSFGEGFVDFDRPLTFSGVSFLREQTEKLALLVPTIDSIAYSPAKRTTETMEVVSAIFPTAKQNAVEKIYGARAPILEDIILHFPDNVQTLLLIGHNPGVSDLFGSHTRNRVLFAPGCFGIINFPIHSWSSILDTKPNFSSYNFGR